ncbi:hypothetical protein BJ508DRAFT_419279 [Ascobolus immersus RN42]|uniref:Carbohydrate esterase family 16 protein n=1 Tax=Ascobolus immersus RN42 TaxID=1160509 RepID=A0A3N4HJT1_ASCIM|nr:hypothetical protein BJ508DRAFT_419279 [Ascobolus immersus RN42]
MVKILTSFAALLSVASVTSATFLPFWPTYKGWKNIDTLFVFGDSYTQTGFNLTNGSPLPSKSNTFGNPPFPGWTSANGPNWIGYLATSYNKTRQSVWNLAYGGATIDSELVKPWRDDVLSLKDQVNNLFVPYLAKPTAPANLKWKADKSLFLFWIGINDIGNSYWLGDFDNFHKKLLDEYFTLVNTLYSKGARNFVFLTVPPVERSPLILGQGEWSIENEGLALASFNAKLNTYVKEFQKKNRAAWTKVFDTKPVFDQMLDQPAKYGFGNVTSYCDDYQNGTPAWDTYYEQCAIPVDQYFWLNSLHPTHKVHKEVAKRLARVL